ncbi:hypothetical protein CKJ90_32940, partial [Klebsiella pneumoniae]
PRGEVGRLMTRGPYTFRGYYNSRNITAEAFDADGFMPRGEVGRLMTRGPYTFRGYYNSRNITAEAFDA